MDQSIEESFKTTADMMQRTFSTMGVREAVHQSKENLIRFQYQMQEHTYIAEIIKSEEMVAVKIYGVVGKVPDQNREKALAYVLERNFILPTVSYCAVGDVVTLGVTLDPMVQEVSDGRFMVTMRELAYYHHLETAAWPEFLKTFSI